MRRRKVFTVLVLTALIAAVVACGSKEEDASEPARKNRTVSPGDFVDYEGPRSPRDTEWLLRSLNGDGAAEGSDITLDHLDYGGESELNVEGGCIGFFLIHKLEGWRIRVVEPGLQVGRLDCGKPEEVKRQTESILDIMRDLARVRVTEDRFELRSASGETATFTPPAPAQVDPALVGTQWFLTSLRDKGPLPRPRLTLEIGKEDIGGFSGCNSFGAAVDKMDEGELAWSSGPSSGVDSTAVGCGPAALARQEMAYQNAVAAAEVYRRQGDRLELRDGRGQTIVVLRQKTRSSFDPAVLENTRWKLRSVDGEKPVEGSVPTIRFGSENEVAWYDGCEDHEGTYEETDYGIVAHRRGPSEGVCVKPETYTSPVACVRVCFYPDGLYRMRDGLLEIFAESENTTTVLEPMGENEELNRDGTPWELRGFVEQGEKTAVRGDAGITLTFDRGTLRMGEKGTMFGSTGCNEYRVAYEYPITRNGLDRLVLEDPVVTRRKCAGPRAVGEQEARFLGILRDVSYYPDTTMNGKMTLDTEDGRELVFSVPD